MRPSDLIEDYADDVARRLPRRLRNDVGFELRALLQEELQARAGESGRPADVGMALALLSAFGRPADVADRYRPASFVIVRPTETRAFAATALLAVGLQWALTLPAVVLRPEPFPGQALVRLGAWWVGWGLGAFWAPGFMVVLMILARGLEHRFPRTQAWTPRRLADPDGLDRPPLALGLAAWALAAFVLVAMPWYAPHLPGALPRVFTLDSGFLRTRGPWLLPVWAAHYALHVVALLDGRWRKPVRRAAAALGLAVCGVLAWFILAGPIFASPVTDAQTKALLALTLVVGLASTAMEVRRESGRVRRPKALAELPGGREAPLA